MAELLERYFQTNSEACLPIYLYICEYNLNQGCAVSVRCPAELSSDPNQTQLPITDLNGMTLGFIEDNIKEKKELGRISK